MESPRSSSSGSHSPARSRSPHRSGSRSQSPHRSGSHSPARSRSPHRSGSHSPARSRSPHRSGSHSPARSRSPHRSTSQNLFERKSKSHGSGSPVVVASTSKVRVNDPALWRQAAHQASKAVVHRAPGTADAVTKVANRAHQIYQEEGGTYTSALKSAAGEHLSDKLGEWFDKGIDSLGQQASKAARAAARYTKDTVLPAAGRAARKAGRAAREGLKVGADVGEDAAKVGADAAEAAV